MLRPPAVSWVPRTDAPVRSLTWLWREDSYSLGRALVKVCGGWGAGVRGVLFLKADLG